MPCIFPSLIHPPLYNDDVLTWEYYFIHHMAYVCGRLKNDGYYNSNTISFICYIYMGWNSLITSYHDYLEWSV